MKPTRSQLTKKLDTICSKIVRSQGHCSKCGINDSLQCCHIYSRRYRSVRWNIELNLVCLCASCHFYFHSDPIAFVEWLEDTWLGKKKYNKLKSMATPIKKWAIAELREMLERYEKLC